MGLGVIIANEVPPRALESRFHCVWCLVAQDERPSSCCWTDAHEVYPATVYSLFLATRMPVPLLSGI